MKTSKEMKRRAEFLRKQFREAPEDTPDDVIWEWIKEFDRLMVALGNRIENNSNSIIKPLTLS